MKVAPRNIILPLSMKKSFRKSFQGFALLSSIFFKRNRIYFQLYTLQIIPCNQLRINLRRVNLSLAFPDPRIFHLYNRESLLSPYIFITIPSQNTLVTSSFGKSLPRTKCYSLIEIFPSLPKLTLPKQIFTRSRDTTTRKLRRRRRRKREACGSLLRYVRSSTTSPCAVDISKNIYDPPLLLFRKLGHLPWQPAKLLIDRPPTSIG